jgi:hypothetical protein
MASISVFSQAIDQTEIGSAWAACAASLSARLNTFSPAEYLQLS